MAPYLLFGFSIASLLHFLLQPEKIKNLLGKPGAAGVLKAALLGIPMPLCSCSVIPVATSFRKAGASRGATASFLSATPQTGVDSILATYALMGGIFSAVRVFIAFVSGCLAGLIIERFEHSKNNFKYTNKSFTFTNATGPNSALKNKTTEHETPRPTLQKSIRHGLYTLPADLTPALALGLFLAGLLTVFLPDQWLGNHFENTWAAFALATAISLPLYICATASIPMAYSFIVAGLSPGAALVFLIVGPATNTTTVIAAAKLLGGKATLLYLVTLVSTAWLAGFLLDTFFETSMAFEATHIHTNDLNFWQHASGIILVLLLAFTYFHSKRPRSSKSNCCAG
jgi:uncharacterized membrane protein YraQ (UPF0718 family)